MMYRSEDEQFPVKAITFNHRQMAFYRAFEENPTAPAVVGTKERGIKSVRMISSTCPPYLVKQLVHLHNLSHGGSGVHIFDLLDGSLEIEQAWQAKCHKTGLTATNAAAYQKHYEEFLFEKSDKFGTYKAFEATKSLAHRLADFGLMKTWRSWCNAHLDFLDTTVSVNNIIATCHATVNTVMSNTKRFYDKQIVGRILLEALKLAATRNNI